MATRIMHLEDVPPMRRSCEHPAHPGANTGTGPHVPVVAFIIARRSRNAALSGGMYVCAEHAKSNARHIFSHIV